MLDHNHCWCCDVEHLPDNLAAHRRCAQRCFASPTRFGLVGDNLVGIGDLTQRFTRRSRLFALRAAFGAACSPVRVRCPLVSLR